MSSPSEDRRVCVVSDGNCTAPAGVGISGGGHAEGDGWARGTCSRCGEPVCGQCSRRTTWRGTRQRWCNNCLEMEGKTT